MSARLRKLRYGLAGAMLLIGLSFSAKGAMAAGRTSTPSYIDADGDDERTELLYHWQDKRFSDEERHQIVVCTLLIATIAGGGAIRRRIRQARYAE